MAVSIASTNAFRVAVSRNNYSLSLWHFLDGSDVYGATALRCLLQFYFSVRLPNSYDHPNIESDLTAGIVGGVAAAVLIAFIVGTGLYYQKKENKLWLKRELTDELLLVFYANGLDEDNYPGDDPDIKAFCKMINDIKIEDSTRLAKLKLFAEKNKADILAEMSLAKTAKKTFTAKDVWEHGYEFVKTYAYVQWIFWMIATIILCQAKEGLTTQGDDLSPGLYPELTGHEWTIWVQLMFGAVVALGALIYDLKKKHDENGMNVHENALKLEAVRKLVNRQKVNSDCFQFCDLENKNDKKGMIAHAEENVRNRQKEYNNAIRYSHTLTLTCTFIGNFLLFNIAAWPIAIFVVDKADPNIGELFFAITIITGALTVIQTTLKHQALSKDEETCNKSIINGFDPSAIIKNHNALTFTRFWWDNPEHRYRGMYFVLGSILGSGGFLLTRVLFSNGIGNVTLKDGKFGMDETMMAHGSVTDPLFFIGAIACVVLMVISMAEYKKGTLRRELVQAANDHQLVHGINKA